MTDQPSALLVEQRIRNGIIDYLELASSFEAQMAYDAAGSPAHVPNEVINQWEDWVHRDPRHHDDHSAVYTSEEIEALRSFQTAWDSAADLTPGPLPALIECQALAPWQDLREAASAALAVFARRGPLSDDAGLAES